MSNLVLPSHPVGSDHLIFCRARHPEGPGNHCASQIPHYRGLRGGEALACPDPRGARFLLSPPSRQLSHISQPDVLLTYGNPSTTTIKLPAVNPSADDRAPCQTPINFNLHRGTGTQDANGVFCLEPRGSTSGQRVGDSPGPGGRHIAVGDPRFTEHQLFGGQ